VVVSGVGAIAFYPVTMTLMSGPMALKLYFAALIGLALTAAMVVITEYYTGTNFSPCRKVRRRVADRSRDEHHRGPGRVDEVTPLPVIAVCIAIWAAYNLGELYAIAIGPRACCR